jgi:hypothetical protein
LDDDGSELTAVPIHDRGHANAGSRPHGGSTDTLAE